MLLRAGERKDFLLYWGEVEVFESLHSETQYSPDVSSAKDRATDSNTAKRLVVLHTDHARTKCRRRDLNNHTSLFLYDSFQTLSHR